MGFCVDGPVGVAVVRRHFAGDVLHGAGNLVDGDGLVLRDDFQVGGVVEVVSHAGLDAVGWRVLNELSRHALRYFSNLS